MAERICLLRGFGAYLSHVRYWGDRAPLRDIVRDYMAQALRAGRIAGRTRAWCSPYPSPGEEELMLPAPPLQHRVRWVRTQMTGVPKPSAPSGLHWWKKPEYLSE